MKMHVSWAAVVSLLLLLLPSNHAADGATAAPPTCCELLTPMLPFLNAKSLDDLQLPVLIFSSNRNGTLLPTKNRIHGSLCTCGGPNGSSHNWMKTKMGIRGSTSVRDFTRKSYGVTTKAGNKTHFLGMPKGKEWFLYAPEGDVALIRNALAYSIWRQMGRWGPRTVWAELFITPDTTTPLTSDSYQGLFMAGEKIWHGKHRINIDKYDASKDPTGGFIFRIEHGKPKDVPEVETRLTGQIILLDYPRKNVSDASLQYLTKYFNDFERQLLAPGLGNFSQYAAPEALVDWFLANELIKSANDGYRGSVYFWKDSASAARDATSGNLTDEYVDSDGVQTSQADGRVVMGPVWDAAKAMGLCCGFPVEGYQNGGLSNGSSGGSAISAEGWLFNLCIDKQRCKIDPINGLAQWYIAMWRDPSFRANASTRYTALRASAWNDAWISSEVKAQAATVQAAALRTYTRWATAFAADKVQLLPPGAADYPASLNASVAYLHDWLISRVHWLDGQLGQNNAAAGLQSGNASNTSGGAPAAGSAADMRVGGSRPGAGGPVAGVVG